MFLLSFYNIFVNIFAKRMLSEFWVCAYLRLLDKQSGSFLTECLFDIHKPRHLEWSHSWNTPLYFLIYIPHNKCFRNDTKSKLWILFKTERGALFRSLKFNQKYQNVNLTFKKMHKVKKLRLKKNFHLMTRVHSPRAGALTARNRLSCKCKPFIFNSVGGGIGIVWM